MVPNKSFHSFAYYGCEGDWMVIACYFCYLFLKMAVILAVFNMSGSEWVVSEYLKMRHKGLHKEFARFLKNFGCCPSGPAPGVLSGFNLFKTLLTFSSVISKVSIWRRISLVGNNGISPLGSTVKTL